MRWERVAVEDEDAFVIEGKFGGFPRDIVLLQEIRDPAALPPRKQRVA